MDQRADGFFLYASRTQYTFYRDLVARTMKTRWPLRAVPRMPVCSVLARPEIGDIASLQQADLAALDSAEANR
jgi:hypothetical protein